MTDQELLEKIRYLTLWGMQPNQKHAAGSREDLLSRIISICELVEQNGARIT